MKSIANEYTAKLTKSFGQSAAGAALEMATHCLFHVGRLILDYEAQWICALDVLHMYTLSKKISRQIVSMRHEKLKLAVIVHIRIQSITSFKL
jgi:hypothetical protein